MKRGVAKNGGVSYKEYQAGVKKRKALKAQRGRKLLP
jgi:hypothetical protein